MIEYHQDIIDALPHGPYEHRTYVDITAYNIETGAPVRDAYWSDHGIITVPCKDPDTGAIQDRQFYGSGGLVSVANIPRILNVEVQRVNITLTQCAPRVNTLLRTYRLKLSPIIVFRGIINKTTMQPIQYAFSRMVGFINNVTITKPAKGETGADAILECVSHTQEFTRSNSEMRTSASQKLREETDDFLDDVESIVDWTFDWGVKADKAVDPKNNPGKKSKE